QDVLDFGIQRYGGGYQTIPHIRPWVTRAMLFLHPVFLSMFLRWVRTVSTEMFKVWAICPSLWPWAKSWRMATSRFESPWTRPCGSPAVRWGRKLPGSADTFIKCSPPARLTKDMVWSCLGFR